MTVTKKTQSKKYLALMIGAIIAGTAGMAQATTERVSVTTGHKQSGFDGADADILPDNNDFQSHSFDPDISADSRFVAFESNANNLAGTKANGTLKDTNGATDIFVHDRRLHTTERVNVNSSGAQSAGPALDPSISEDGRYIAFVSAADDLVIGDSGDFTDIFVHDRKTGETRRVSVTAKGAEANGNSTEPFISNNGRYVSFTSEASNLLGNKPGVTPTEPVDNNDVADIYRVDLQTGDIKRISFGRNNDDGTPDEANKKSGHSSMSTNGQLIAFHSDATNLLGYERDADGKLDKTKPLDKNGKTDVFWVDIDAYSTHIASVDSGYNLPTATTPGIGNSTNPVISSDGKYIAFQSDASNLVKGDNNGVTDIFRHETHIDQNVFGGDTIRVSVNSNPTVNQANDASTNPDINGNGDIVVFESVATNLVSDDTNALQDIFSRKISTGETKRLSVDNNNSSKSDQIDETAKRKSNDNSYLPSIASYGTAVAFESDASNLLLNTLENKPGTLSNATGVFVPADPVLVQAAATAAADAAAATVASAAAQNTANTAIATSAASDSAAVAAALNVPGSEVADAIDALAAANALDPANPAAVAAAEVNLQAAVDPAAILADPVINADAADADPAVAEPAQAALDAAQQALDDQVAENAAVAAATTAAATATTAAATAATAAAAVGATAQTSHATNKDDNRSRDIFVSYVNHKPDFYIANQTLCKNAGIQDAHIIQNVSDGDYLGVNHAITYSTVSNSNPDLFGGLLGAGGEPYGSWPSNVLYYQPQRGATGTAEICITAQDNGGTYCDGQDSYTHCFNITVDPSCDNGAGDIFKVEFPNLYLNFGRGRNLFDQSKSGYESYTATIDNKGAASGEPVTFKLNVENADEVTTADSRCGGDTLTGEYVCNLDGVPEGKTEITFKVRASNPDDVRASVIEVQPGHADIPRSAGTAAASDTSTPGSTEGASSGSGGGSLGWLSLLGLALFRRRR